MHVPDVSDDGVHPSFGSEVAERRGRRLVGALEHSTMVGPREHQEVVGVARDSPGEGQSRRVAGERVIGGDGGGVVSGVLVKESLVASAVELGYTQYTVIGRGRSQGLGSARESDSTIECVDEVAADIVDNGEFRAGCAY